MEKPLETARHDNVSIATVLLDAQYADAVQSQPPAAATKSLRAFRGKFKLAFMSQKKRFEPRLDLGSSKQLCSQPCIIRLSIDSVSMQQPCHGIENAELTDPVTLADGIPVHDAEESRAAQHEQTPNASTKEALSNIEDENCSAPSGLELHSGQPDPNHDTSRDQMSELAVSPDTQNGSSSPVLPALRRVKSYSTLIASRDEVLSTGGVQAQPDFVMLKLRLISASLEDSEPFSSAVQAASPGTPSTRSFGAESRRDSGLGLSYAVEAQRWKRACHVQQDAHKAELDSLSQKHKADARVAEERLNELKKTHELEMASKEEQVSTIMSMYQGLNIEHDKLKAQKPGSPASSGHSAKAVTSSGEIVILKSRLEQRDQDLAKALEAKQALQVELTNTRYVNDVAAFEFAEIRVAWEQEVTKNRELANKTNKDAAVKLAEMKTLWEKECVTNMQARLALENDPSKTAEMDRTIDHLRKELMDSELVNNQHVAAFDELEKKFKREQDIAKAELAAAAAQNETLSDAAHEFCKRKRTFQQATDKLVDEHPSCENHRDLSKALNRYCDTVTYEKQLEAFIEKGTERLTETFCTIRRLEIQLKQHETEAEEQKTNCEILEVQSKDHANKVTRLEIDANHRAGELSKLAAEKDTHIHQLQSQMKQIEAQVATGIDACTKWFLDTKDQEIANTRTELTAANQRIDQLRQDLHTKQIFEKLDGDHRQGYVEDLEQYPPRLAAAEKELQTLRNKLENYDLKYSAPNWIDFKTHELRVAEVRTQTRAQVADEVRAEVQVQVKTETEQRLLNYWMNPLAQLGSFLWARIRRLEQPLIDGGLNVWDQERFILAQQSRRLRVSGAESPVVAVANAGSVVAPPQQGHQGPVQYQGRPQHQRQ